MKICIAGKNNIAVESLLKVIEFQEQDKMLEILVLCNKNEKGKNTWQKSLQWFAKKNDIKIVELSDLYAIKDLVFISLEFDQIVIPRLFSTPYLFNIHFSNLPSYKGMYTSAMPILNNESIAGVTLHKIDAGIDTGEIIEQKLFDIEKEDNAKDLYCKYIQNGIELVLGQLRTLTTEPWNVKSDIQKAEGSTYYSSKVLDYKHLYVNLYQTAENIVNQIRAFSFREYQLPRIYDENIIRAKITNRRSTLKPGEIVEKKKNSIIIASIDYDVELFKDRFESLLLACKEGDLLKVKEICTNYNYKNEQDKHGWSALMVATFYNQKEIVDYLLNIDANWKAVNYNGTNLLMYAKEAYKNYGDSYLLKVFYKLGIKGDYEDYLGHNLYDYCKKESLSLPEFI